jgi:alkylation response protein AidB-like acyl-CoA dehydrogenase
MFYEFARWDVSIATFMVVQNCLGLSVVDRVGGEEQKKRILPDTIAFKKFICFGLTEPTHGSDATSLLSTAKKTQGGFLITGKKRWIGNATFADYIIVWARNVDEGNKIQGFIVEKGSKGLKTSKIENKYSIRMVVNADIEMTDVFVPENNRLENALDFASGANNILKHSRIYIAWLATGCAAGAIEAALKYTSQRKQFGKSIDSFQIIQEKLQRAVANVESMIQMCHRVSVLYQQGQASMG